MIGDKKIVSSVIKNANDLTSFKFVTTTLYSFLLDYKASKTKRFFPYERFDSPDNLDSPDNQLLQHPLCNRERNVKTSSEKN